MIVVASDNPSVVDEVSTLLRQRGDLFTVAADETLALSAIRAERASMLIADCSSISFDGFTLCRDVRGDETLWNLPVICIVEPAGLATILSVLDCSADGFLMRPLDLSAVSLAIGDLQGGRAAGTDRAAVRTRYRIDHEGREFSVVADRRQLLEFLLAAFEGSVRMRKEWEEILRGLEDEIHGISERLGALTAERDATVTNLHAEIEERNRVIARVNTALQAAEQAEALVKMQKENISQELKELGGTLEEARKADGEKARAIASLESDLAAAAREKAATEKEHAEQIRSLEARYREIEAERDSASSTVAGLRVSSAELERSLAALRSENSGQRETISALEQSRDRIAAELKSAHAENEALGEKARAMQAATEAKEREARTAIDNLVADMKSIQDALQQNIRQMEQELSARRELEQQVASLTRERDALSVAQGEARTAIDNLVADMKSIQDALEQNIRQMEQELSARRELEQQVASLTRERDALSAMQGEAKAALADISDARLQLATLRESHVRAQTECDAMVSEHERTQDVLDATYRELALAKEEVARLKRESGEAIRTKGDADALREQLARCESECLAAKGALEREQRARAETGVTLAALQEKFDKSRHFVDSASRDIGVLNTALEQERDKRKGAEDRLLTSQTESAQKDRIIAALRSELSASGSAASEAATDPESSSRTGDLKGTDPGPDMTGTHPPVPGPGVDPVTATRQPTSLSEEPAGADTAADAQDPMLRLSPPQSYQMNLPASESAIPLPGPKGSASHGSAETVTQPPKPSEGGMEPGAVKPATVPEAPPAAQSPQRPGEIPISRDRWLDITKWAHHTPAVTEEQRKDIIANLMRLSKLVQKGRHLTNRQEQEIRALIARVQSLGYRFM